jgi:hypothetical protein
VEYAKGNKAQRYTHNNNNNSNNNNNNNNNHHARLALTVGHIDPK